MPNRKYLPHEVRDDEYVVRAIKSPFHLTKTGKLKRSAFDPPRGSADISVIRLRIGSDSVKNRSVEIASGGPATYRGLASGNVAAIRAVGLDVICDQVPFAGHANIRFPIEKPATGQEPAPPEVIDELDRLKESLLDTFVYFEDAAPTVAGWVGPSLEAD